MAVPGSQPQTANIIDRLVGRRWDPKVRMWTLPDLLAAALLNLACNTCVANRVKVRAMTEASDGGIVGGLIDSRGLAARLGVSQATVRSWRNRGVSWLPEPAGRLDGHVWREQDLAGIEELMPGGTTGRSGELRRAGRSDRLVESSDRRAKGIFYTPGDAAHLMARWLVRHDEETYLEPSLGDGAFVEAVKNVISTSGRLTPTWVTCELDERSMQEAVRRGLIKPEEARFGDFLQLPVTMVDGVIANPPYVRLRHLDEPSRRVALTVADQYLGTTMAPSGSIWMPFVLKMIASIKPGGRMAVVLPLDFTYVGYAIPLWEYLANSFDSLTVLRSRERVFPEINQDVLILLADGRGGATDEVRYVAYETVSDMVAGIKSVGGVVEIASILAGERAFQRQLLPAGLEDLVTEAKASSWIMPASDMAAFHIGYVAGNKKYFHPDAATAKSYRLPEASLRPALVNARKLRGQGLWTSGVSEAATDHLWLPGDDLSSGEQRYVHYGEQTGVSAGYKASLRQRWYVVPAVREPDAIVSVFSDRPMVLVNDASWVATNSFLCAYMRQYSAVELAAAWYNPLTLLTIGLEVHSLGGGVVVMVPNEASRVSVLQPDKARADVKQIHKALLSGDMLAAYDCGSGALRKIVGRAGCELIEEGLQVLANWRVK